MTDTRAAVPEGGRPSGSTSLTRSGSQPRQGLLGRLSLYYRQIIAELRKVIWPTRKQLITYTTVVIAFVLIVMAFVSVLDLAFGKLVLWVFG